MNNILAKTCLNVLRQNPLNIIKLPFSTESEKKTNNLNTNVKTDCSVDDKLEFLNKKSILYNQGWNNLNVSVCSRSSNSFYLSDKTGEFNCLKCNKKGNWDEFKSFIENISEKKSCKPIDSNEPDQLPLSAEIFKASKEYEEWSKAVPISTLSLTEMKIMLRNSNKELLEINKRVFDKLELRIFDKKILVPIYDEDSIMIDVIELKTDSSQDVSLKKKKFIFNHEAFNKKSNEIFITDQIINSIALTEALNKPCLAINSTECLTPKIIALFEKYEKIIFWQKDAMLSYNLAQVLNLSRCNLISYSRSPYESFILGENIDAIVKNEQFDLRSNSIVKFAELKNQVFSEVADIKKFTGIQWKRLTPLNNILKGHRPGELTILTGPTGSGKTTFLSEYSLDLSIQGLTTLWGSFEIQNHRLAKMMMTQYAGLNLNKNIQLFDYISTEFSKLPIYFMNFHGQEKISNVVRTMANAVVLYGVKHVIVDNLQFMVGDQFTNTIDRFNHQDLIVGKFRRFATTFNCHVTLVIHPKKEDNGEPLKISSIFGMAKCTQEADNVLILQEQKIPSKDNKISWQKYIEVCKNRFDGDLGKVTLKFEKDKLSYSTSMPNNRHRHHEEVSLPFNNDLTNSNNEININDNLEIENFSNK